MDVAALGRGITPVPVARPRKHASAPPPTRQIIRPSNRHAILLSAPPPTRHTIRPAIRHAILLSDPPPTRQRSYSRPPSTRQIIRHAILLSATSNPTQCANLTALTSQGQTPVILSLWSSSRVTPPFIAIVMIEGNFLFNVLFPFKFPTAFLQDSIIDTTFFIFVTHFKGSSISSRTLYQS